ncbi:hypothetical protein [Microlunatus parietis]|uniref:Polyketide cyclase / dehydrase and lipid transport n=1 Tax=Microlunatus parietis TaxID=682979 RepID=A0A7Y9I5J5_9ACTN|nr:hypothetical protein [Microlunatus parietis]NYE70416.1 hypothetical protein [Microlunatus parietis]
MTLPQLDAHTATIEAPGPVVWEAVCRYATSLARADLGLLGRALGTVPSSGFAPDGKVEVTEVALAGRHRFARYRLVFTVTAGDRPGATTVTIASYAGFAGLRGRVYRALLIGTGGHLLAVRRMLESIRRDSGARRR